MFGYKILKYTYSFDIFRYSSHVSTQFFLNASLLKNHAYNKPMLIDSYKEYLKLTNFLRYENEHFSFKKCIEIKSCKIMMTKKELFLFMLINILIFDVLKKNFFEHFFFRVSWKNLKN